MSDKSSIIKKLYKNLRLLSANEVFMNDVSRFLDKHKEHVPEMIETDYGDTIFLDYQDTQEFNEELRKFKEKFGLSDLYDLHLKLLLRNNGNIPDLSVLEDYGKPEFQIVHDIENYDILPDELTVEKIYLTDLPISEKLVIEIYPETTITDIQNAWSDIKNELKKIKKTNPNKFSSSKRIERDLEIYKLKSEGKTCTEITKIINEDDRFKEQKIQYQEVSKIIQRLKERAKRIIPSKNI